MPAREVTVRDPIHDYIRLAREAAAVVDLPEFQRLRRVRQLGTANLVYPGANHTRFEHALGAYHLASRAAGALALSDDDARSLTLAALLHDLGHGPFSHLSEPILEEHLGASHLALTVRRVTEGPVADALRAQGVDPVAVSRLIRGEGLLGGLVAGGLDVDRMDYLVRDGHYTGVRIGVDLARLTSEIRLRTDRLVLRESAVAAAEMLLATRFTMYAAVYYHRTCRVAEAMMRRAIEATIASGGLAPQALASMDDVGLLAVLRGQGGEGARLLALIEGRRLLKPALDVPWSEARAVWVGDLVSSSRRRRRIEEEVAKDARLPPEAVLLDVPPVAEGRTEVEILRDGGALEPLSSVSSLVATLGQAARDHWRLRFYAPHDARERVAKAGAAYLQ
ncbi:MAG: HD domain-containing protein [Methanobacteriota archaeon]